MKNDKKVKLRLHLSSICNLNCSYCYEDKNINWSIMSLSNFKKILKIFSWTEITNLYLYWWEPLLAKDILNYLISLKKLPDNVHHLWMTTNWTLLTKEIINYIESTNSNINISIDWNKKSHDLNRKYKNWEWSYNWILENIKHISNFHKFNISYTIWINNVEYMFNWIIELIKLWFEKESIGINFLYENIWDHNYLNKLILNLLRVKRFNILTYDNFYNELNYDNWLSCKNHMLDSISIWPNLEILPCWYFWSKTLTNISKDTGLYNIWYLENENYLDIEKNLEKFVFSNKFYWNIMKERRLCEVSDKFIKNKIIIHKILKNTMK